MNITNIDISNGYIYFHANSVPYTLENMYNAEFFARKESEIQEKKIDSEELEHCTIQDYIEYIDEYILFNKHDWNKIESSDTDCYLESIDKNYFDSEFCESYFNDFSGIYYFLFKVNNNFIRISILNKSNIEITENRIRNNSARTNKKLEFEEVNEIFVSTYKESESYLSVVAKEILIRSHQDYLLSKKQIVVTI